jgi:predicted RNase H-like HicB family nuclease
MKSYVFQVVVEEDVQEDRAVAFHGYCPALSGCHTWGRTADEALVKVQEAVTLYVEDLIESGATIPTGPSRGATEYASPSVVVNV